MEDRHYFRQERMEMLLRWLPDFDALERDLCNAPEDENGFRVLNDFLTVSWLTLDDCWAVVDMREDPEALDAFLWEYKDEFEDGMYDVMRFYDRFGLEV